MFSAFAPLWYAIILTGRFPFYGGINKETGFLEVTYRRKSVRFVVFCLTSLVMFLMMTLSMISTFMILNEYLTGKEKDRIRDVKLKQLKLDIPKNSSVHPYV